MKIVVLGAQGQLGSDIVGRLPGTVVFDADQALSFFDRPRAVRAAKDLLGLTLCGAEAPPCPG